MSASDFEETKSTTNLPVLEGVFKTDKQGNVCPVLDVAYIDCSDAVPGRKSATTFVRPAEAGEGFNPTFKNGAEGFDYIAKEGDAVFVNSPTDQYVPPAKDGGRLTIA